MKRRHIFLILCTFFSMQPALSALPDLSEITPQAKARLTDKILSHEEINQGADETQNTYIDCLSQTTENLKAHFPHATQEALIGIIGSNCSSPEDLFNIYNILLASSKSDQPMSEIQAAGYLDNSYKTVGRENSNSAIRLKILKLLNTGRN